MKHVARAALCVLSVASLLWSSAALAQALPSRTECLDAHRNAQELKRSAKFLEAQEHLLVCSSGSCPGAIISDCGNWITELEQVTPSMVFQIRRDGKEALEATVLVDGKPIADRAQAVKVNPGRHTIHVELPPFPPRDEDVVLPEGQRMRLIEVEFKSQPVAAPVPVTLATPPKKELERPTPVLVYPLLAVGIAGLASFGTFSILGKSEQGKLEDRCAPRCDDDELSTMKRFYLVGDISAGVGAASLLGAAIVYLTRPSREVERSGDELSFQLGPVRGASASSFGVGASRRW